MIHRIYSTLFLLIIPIFLSAQANTCLGLGDYIPVYSSQEIENAIQKLSTLRNHNLDTIRITPIILVDESSGAKAISKASIDKILKQANILFKITGLQFRYCEDPIEITSTEYYELNTIEATELNKNYKRNNTINIYFVNELTFIDEEGIESRLCGVASFPNEARQDRFIVLDGNCVGTGSLLAHELGHFYGLFHTHETSFGEELVLGFNCDFAGDLLCDTPADPLLSSTNVISCRYNGDETDAEGEAYKPNVRNIMSYSPEECKKEFSFGQIVMMRLIHENENNYLINDCFLPDLRVGIDTLFAAFTPGQAIALPITIYNDGKQELLPVNLKVYFSDDPNVNLNPIKEQQLILPPQLSSFSLTIDIVLPIDLPESTQYIILEIDPNEEIAELNEGNNLATYSYLVEYSNLGDLSLYPNPVNDYSRIFIRDDQYHGRVIIDLFNMSGQRIKTLFGVKQFDTFQYEMDTSLLKEGLYIIGVIIDGKKSYYQHMVKF